MVEMFEIIDDKCPKVTPPVLLSGFELHCNPFVYEERFWTSSIELMSYNCSLRGTGSYANPTGTIMLDSIFFHNA
jgi:hypothetical protein